MAEDPSFIPSIQDREASGSACTSGGWGDRGRRTGAHWAKSLAKPRSSGFWERLTQRARWEAVEEDARHGPLAAT